MEAFSSMKSLEDKESHQMDRKQYKSDPFICSPIWYCVTLRNTMIRRTKSDKDMP